jgi:group I intron endonuclease
MSQGIYKITNLINDKCYIGQSVEIEKRWRSHIKTSSTDYNKYYEYPLYRAFRKHGTNNFKFEILELVPNKKDLTIKEQHYYNIYNPTYNQMKPISCAVEETKKRVLKVSTKDYRILDSYESLNEAARKNNMNMPNLSKATKGIYIKSGGFHWVLESEYFEGWEPRNIVEPFKRKILKIDKETKKILEVFDSTIDAGKNMGVRQTSISAVCSGKHITLKGFNFCYEDDWFEGWKPIQKKRIRNDKKKKKVIL